MFPNSLGFGSGLLTRVYVKKNYDVKWLIWKITVKNKNFAVIPEDSANMPRELYEKASCQNLPMEGSITWKGKKSSFKSDYFILWSRSFVKFFHDAFEASSRDQICGKKFWGKMVPGHVCRVFWYFLEHKIQSKNYGYNQPYLIKSHI